MERVTWILAAHAFGMIIFAGMSSARGPPTVISEVTQRQIARVGDKIRLSCPVEADPTPLLQWSKDGESINRGWERFKMMQMSLRIKDAVVEDTGTYECKATNGFGHVTVDYILIVLHANQSVPPPGEAPSLPGNPERPRFSDLSLMQENVVIRPVGQNVRLHCPASGSPTPEIRWFKNGVYFDATLASRNVNIQDQMHEYRLYDDWDDEIDEFTLSLPGLEESDSGDYKCVISNLYGEESFTYTLQVVASTTKPIIVPPNPRNTTVKFGATASFMCEVRSLDQPHIQWLKRVDGPVSKKDNMTTIRVNGQQFIVLKAGEVLPRSDGSFLNKLTIDPATEKDSGMYICLGANSRGYNFRSAFLTVLPSSLYRNFDEDQFADYNSDYSDQITQEATFWDNRALPIIIGVPAGVILIIIAIIICVIKRKQTREPAPQSTNQVVRVQRFPPQQQQHPYTPAQMEKAYNHQYAALHPQNYTIQSAPSQERITKTYSDKQSDVSLGCPQSHNSSTPPLPPLAPTPTLVQQHTHMHYYQRT